MLYFALTSERLFLDLAAFVGVFWDMIWVSASLEER